MIASMKDTVLSPFKIVAEYITDKLAPSAPPDFNAAADDKSSAVPAAAPAEPTKAAAAPAPVKKAASKLTAKAAAGTKKVAPSPSKGIKKSPVKVKQEAQRSTPHRSSRKKAGFFNEKNLVSLACAAT